MCYKLVTKFISFSFRVVLEVVVEIFFDENLDEASFALVLAALKILLTLIMLIKSFRKDLKFFFASLNFFFIAYLQNYYLLKICWSKYLLFKANKSFFNQHHIVSLIKKTSLNLLIFDQF